MKRVLIFGCFDLFHAGHIDLFERAANLGSLIVAVGDDARVRSLKGEGRPIIPQAERLAVVKACKYVDKAFIFSVDPRDEVGSHVFVIAREMPNILISGQDSNITQEQIDLLRNNCIKYIRLPSHPLHTSDIIGRIRNVTY